MRDYLKLQIWQLARVLAKEIYVLTGKFPKSEIYGLVSQMRSSTDMTLVSPMADAELEDAEVKLLKKIDLFEDVVGRAYNGLAPNLIANYCFELAKDFNEFYHACPVLGSKSEGFRLALVGAFRVVMGKGLDLLGIETLKKM